MGKQMSRLHEGFQSGSRESKDTRLLGSENWFTATMGETTGLEIAYYNILLIAK